MNEPGDQPWSQAEHLHSMEDDFSPFFDLENTGIDLSLLDENANNENWTQDGGAQQHSFATMGLPDPVSYQHQFNMAQHDTRQYHGHYSVPPTPNSSAIYPKHAAYTPNSDSQMQYTFNRYQQNTGNSFTPMVSPDVSASSAYSFIPQYAKPGEYLSPLTSPAINPQVAPPLETSQNSTAPSSLTTSPVLTGFESVEDAQAGNDRPRKTRKKSTTTSTPPKSRQTTTTKNLRSRAASIRKPGKEKSSGQNATGLQTDSQSYTTSRSGSLEYMPNTSGSKSVSPRPVDETAMAPPPKPNSAKTTPSTTPLQHGIKAPGTSNGLPPATPASIMRLPKTHSSTNQAQMSPRGELDGTSPTIGELGNGLEDLTLPEAAAAASRPTYSSSSVHGPAQSTPKSHPETPLSTAIDSRSKGDGKAGQSLRKRGSIMPNSHISPAVRPRISPSIKPLLPEGATPISNDAHALILASKSNYQNILEGNQLISYPSELSNNLTSKRTSHKLAEQGRRNRINIALQEMQGLLPTSLITSDGKEQSSDGNKESKTETSGDGELKDGERTPTTPATASNNSKAATVEMAIVHIKEMHKKLTTKELENEQLKEQVLALQAKLEHVEDESNEA